MQEDYLCLLSYPWNMIHAAFEYEMRRQSKLFNSAACVNCSLPAESTVDAGQFDSASDAQSGELI